MSGIDLAYLLGNVATKKPRSVEWNQVAPAGMSRKISWRIQTEFSFFMTQDSRRANKRHIFFRICKKMESIKRNKDIF